MLGNFRKQLRAASDSASRRKAKIAKLQEELILSKQKQIEPHAEVGDATADAQDFKRLGALNDSIITKLDESLEVITSQFLVQFLLWGHVDHGLSSLVMRLPDCASFMLAVTHCIC
jgi:hypothetical protein